MELGNVAQMFNTGVTTIVKWNWQMLQECSMALAQQMLSGTYKCRKNAKWILQMFQECSTAVLQRMLS